MCLLSPGVSEDAFRELNNKLDALLGLIAYVTKRNFSLSKEWVIGFLLSFGLSEKSVTFITDATEDELRRARFKAKTSKIRRSPSFWDFFREK